MGHAQAARGELGELLRRYRSAACLTQEELAERAGLSARAVANLERGRTARPHHRSVRTLADALELSGPERQRLIDAASVMAGAGGEPESASPGAAEQVASSGLVVPRQLPASVPHFTGRAAELRVLNSLLDAGVGNGAPAMAAIAGTAGVGKSALAVHWAHLVADRFPDGQLYVNLRGFDPSGEPVGPDEAVRGFLDALGISADRIPSTAQGQAGLYRSLLAGKRVLVVLDNARDPEQVRALLPGTATCMTLVTSRSQLGGLVAAHGAAPLTLDVLSPAEARQMLTCRLTPARVNGDQQAAAELTQLCGRLPLALAIASARAAARPGLTLRELSAQLRAASRRLDAMDTGDVATSVRAVFSWSYTLLTPRAARMFRLLGLHPWPDVSAEAAASLAGTRMAHARDDLRELADSHLVTEDRTGRFGCHDLLRAYASELANATDTDGERHDAIVRMLDHYLHTALSADRLLYPVRRLTFELGKPAPAVTLVPVTTVAEAMTWLQAQHTAMLAVIDMSRDGGLDEYTWRLAFALETFCCRRSLWHDWAAMQRTALDAARRTGHLRAQASACRGIGYAQGQLGRLAEARASIAEALWASIQAGDLHGQAQAYLDLASSMEAAGNPHEALAAARRALTLAEAGSSECAALHAAALNAVGWFLAMIGGPAEALGYCEQALALQRELGNRHMEPPTLDSLGYVHSHLGHHAEAAAYYREACHMFEDLGFQYQRAQSLAYAGNAYLAAGDVPAARDAWTQAVPILDSLNHPLAKEVSTSLRQIAADMTPVGQATSGKSRSISAGRVQVKELDDQSANLQPGGVTM
jgi:transcriptional regulator with XRE-family HTH domain/tetratricopeptide (TPR) repeat protein